MSRISTIVSQSERDISNDKNFIYKFSFLLVVIVGLSSYIIMQSYSTVDNLSKPYQEHIGLATLETVEREINGNRVNLAIVEDDFSELASIDLSGIVMPSRSVTQKSQSTQVVHNIPQRIDAQILPAVKATTQEPKKAKVFISSQEGNSLSFIKKKFYATNNSAFSIKLAKRFFESNKYEQALKWTLITNEIDAKSEESWIMFAKIKEKMGKKQDAINALNEYLKHQKSIKVAKLLKNLRDRA